MKRSSMAILRWGVTGLLIVGVAGQLGCQRRPRITSVNLPRKTLPAAPSKPSEPEVAVAGEPDLRYQKVVRPMLIRRGCDSGPCHSTFRGGGLQFVSGDPKDPHDYQAILALIDRKEPEKSTLLLKASGQVRHNGGRNLSEKSCDFQRLQAWIGNRPDLDCSDEPTPDPARFVREVAPALNAMGCVGCHGEAAARVRFDLSALVQKPSQPDRARLALAASNPSPYMTWASSVIRAADAADGKHQIKFDPRSCAYRRLYGYLAQAPELSCEVETKEQLAQPINSQLPDFTAFVQHVLPAIGKRGCFDVSCHGGGAGHMTLFGVHPNGSTGWHEFLNLTARVEDFAHPEKSTFLTTVRNQVAHGGGQRLGGAGDCIDDLVTSWLSRKPVKPCPAPSAPSYERFVKEIQPVLDQMTCSQKRCHGETIITYRLHRFAHDPGFLRENYEQTIRQIDLDFMPFSAVQLRMREPCAYDVVGNWILKKPRPSCVVHDPDPKIFPRMGDEEKPMHPTFEGRPQKT